MGLLVSSGIPGKRHGGGDRDDTGRDESVVELPGPAPGGVEPEANRGQRHEVEDVSLLGLLERAEQACLDKEEARHEQRHRSERELAARARVREQEHESQDRPGDEHES